MSLLLTQCSCIRTQIVTNSQFASLWRGIEERQLPEQALC